MANASGITDLKKVYNFPEKREKNLLVYRTIHNEGVSKALQEHGNLYCLGQIHYSQWPLTWEAQTINVWHIHYLICTDYIRIYVT